MLELTISISGKTIADLESSMSEINRLIADGNTSGANQNESSRFNFDISGEEQALKTETNTPEMWKRVLAAARKKLQKNNLSAGFEHGQWWIIHVMTGAQWSVVDAEGPGSVDGFDFEQVTHGQE
jgi:hypothetical protein